MQAQRLSFGWVLRLDAGEEIVAELRRFAAASGVRAGLITGIGSVGRAELGFFVRSTLEYTRRTFTGDHEVLSLLGNFSVLEGEPFPHCHLILAGDDYAAHGGHLFSAIVSMTCEIHVVTGAGDVLLRPARPDLGFHPLAPRAD
jgi:predicted DNA-binding protein with PD1-like motif